MLVALNPSERKKWVAIFSDGTRVHFGGRGCMDYTLYYKQFGPEVARKKRLAYIKRHRVNEDWNDPKAPGTLSRYILWEYPDVELALAMYHRHVKPSKASRKKIKPIYKTG